MKILFRILDKIDPHSIFRTKDLFEKLGRKMPKILSNFVAKIYYFPKVCQKTYTKMVWMFDPKFMLSTQKLPLNYLIIGSKMICSI